LTAQIRLQPGDVLNFAEVKRGLERIKTMYMDKGYVNFSYIPDHQIHTDSRTMDLTFTIQEDLRFRVAYIGIVGCGEQEEEDKVRALLVLKPGDFFSYSALDSSVTAINKSGLYREIKESDYTIAPLDEKPGLLSVVFYLTPNTPRP
jgi:outer membrane protein assembly factor BamA